MLFRSIPALDLAQRQEGWVTRPAIEEIARILDMPAIRVLEVATFYTMFNLQPVGKHHVQVCTSLSCAVRGASDVVKACKDKLGIGMGGVTAELFKDTTLRLLPTEGGLARSQALAMARELEVPVVALSQLSESLQHANVRMPAGPVLSRLWVTPRFHRAHHSIESGEHNFGVLLPWWDMLFGTANFEQRYDPTGVRDQVEQGRNYGSGFWQQQWLGVLRLLGRA